MGRQRVQYIPCSMSLPTVFFYKFSYLQYCTALGWVMCENLHLSGMIELLHNMMGCLYLYFEPNSRGEGGERRGGTAPVLKLKTRV